MVGYEKQRKNVRLHNTKFRFSVIPFYSVNYSRNNYNSMTDTSRKLNLFIFSPACLYNQVYPKHFTFPPYPTNGATNEVLVFLREVSPGDGVSPKLHNIMGKGINSGWKTCVYHQNYHYPLICILMGTFWSYNFPRSFRDIQCERWSYSVQFYT